MCQTFYRIFKMFKFSVNRQIISSAFAISPTYCRALTLAVQFSDLGTRSFFQIRSPLILIPWIAIAHFADFQVRSSLNRSKKGQWFALIKES